MGLPCVLAAQSDTLPSSIAYSGTDNDGAHVRFVDHNHFTRKHVELKNANLIYIEAHQNDTYRNAEKINARLIKEMENYPYKFDTFPNEYKYKGSEFFLNQGYDYRLVIIVSTVMKIYGNNKKFSQTLYTVGIESLQTGKVYIYMNSYGYSIFLKKFIKAAKKSDK